MYPPRFRVAGSGPGAELPQRGGQRLAAARGDPQGQGGL